MSSFKAAVSALSLGCFPKLSSKKAKSTTYEFHDSLVDSNDSLCEIDNLSQEYFLTLESRFEHMKPADDIIEVPKRTGSFRFSRRGRAGRNHEIAFVVDYNPTTCLESKESLHTVQDASEGHELPIDATHQATKVTMSSQVACFFKGFSPFRKFKKSPLRRFEDTSLEKDYSYEEEMCCFQGAKSDSCIQSRLNNIPAIKSLQTDIKQVPGDDDFDVEKGLLELYDMLSAAKNHVATSTTVATSNSGQQDQIELDSTKDSQKLCDIIAGSKRQVPTQIADVFNLKHELHILFESETRETQTKRSFLQRANSRVKKALHLGDDKILNIEDMIKAGLKYEEYSAMKEYLLYDGPKLEAIEEE